MRSNLLYVLVLAALVAVSPTANVYGQNKDPNERTNIVVVDQPDCPLRLIPAPTEKYPYLLKFSNAGKRAVQAFVLVNEYPSFVRVETDFPSRPIEFGVDSKWNTGFADNTRHYFDYVLFTDGSSWGEDKFGMSEEIGHILARRTEVLKRLNELAIVYPDLKNVLERTNFFGVSSIIGPPEPITIAKLEMDTQSVWKSVIRTLRRITSFPVEANAIADQLEKEIPASPAVLK